MALLRSNGSCTFPWANSIFNEACSVNTYVTSQISLTCRGSLRVRVASLEHGLNPRNDKSKHYDQTILVSEFLAYTQLAYLA